MTSLSARVRLLQLNTLFQACRKIVTEMDAKKDENERTTGCAKMTNEHTPTCAHSLMPDTRIPSIT